MDARRLSAGLTAVVLAISTPLAVRFEGKRLTPYRDIGGMPTACIGHTGPDVVMGRPKTDAECSKLLQADQLNALEGIAACVHGEYDPRTWAGLLDMAFNLGVPTVCRSSVVRRLNAGEWPQACDAILLYRYAGGRDCFAPENAEACGGIATRRRIQRQLCRAEPVVADSGHTSGP